MDWVFIILALLVIWYVEKQFGDLSTSTKIMEDRVTELGSELEEVKRQLPNKNKP
jgi:hypothetical protein